MPFEIAPHRASPDCTPETEESLHALVALLRRLPEERWDYGWTIMPKAHRESLGLPQCGTVGCALGHAEAVGLGAFYDLPDSVRWAFFFNGQAGGKMGRQIELPFKNGWQATQYDVADRIEHWLATGEIR